MSRKAFFLPLIAVFSACAIALHAQTPTQIAPQQPPSATGSAAAPPAQADDDAALLASLRQLKAANDQLLKRQQATLAQLEELEKAANQVRVFSGQR